ncbi:peptide ABC transporter substrate-binding protein [Bacillus spongiae]|uniref:Peptide ABC transporter substrate-binding protein n=1 Tax=Bacillus spongiae TaxID=2683610 RepID=A0ABU8HB57_9BACI
MKKKLSFLLVLLLALSTFLAACGGDTDEDTQKDTGNDTDKERPQVLNLRSGEEIPKMSPTKASDSVSFEVMNSVYEGLYRLGEGDEPVLGMAESEPEISEDGKTYTFTIRDAKWSDGSPVTAHDFEYAWKKVLDPETEGVQYAYIMYDIKGAYEAHEKGGSLDDVGVKATDEKTLVVELNSVAPYFKGLLSFATFYPQKQEYVEAQGEEYALEADKSLYNGPFVLSEWKHEQSYQLKKNPDYWDADTVKLEEINYNIVKDTSTVVSLYETNRVDIAGLNSEYVDKWKDDPNFYTRETSTLFYLRFNHTNDILKNVNARKAISMAIDKESVVDVLLNNGSVPADYFVPANFVTGPDGKDFREVNGDMNVMNLEEAKKLWKTAKEEEGIDSFELELLNYDGENARKFGEYIKEQLEGNLEGLTVSISQQPFKQKLKREEELDYDFAYSGWGPDYPDPMTYMDMFITDGPNNQTGWSNAEFDSLIEQSKGELTNDLPARWQAMADAEKLLFDEAVISPMYQRGSSYLEREFVKGVIRHSFGADVSFKWAYIE